MKQNLILANPLPAVKQISKISRHLLSRRPPKKKPTKRFRQRKDEEAESLLERKLTEAVTFYIPELTMVPQYYFHSERKWRFDLAYPEKSVAIEVQGYGPTHNSFEGMQNDCEKHNAAMLLGWKIIYFMSPDLEDVKINQTISLIRRVLGLNANPKTNNWSSEIEDLRKRLTSKTDI